MVHAGSAAGFGRQKESGRAVEQLINPFLLFLGLAIGGVGLCAALPRRRVNPQVLGAVLGGLGLGVVLLALGLKNPGQLPNYNFYIFGFIAVGSALRVITHPRPVYAALYFILTILASCGLYLILSAEFMAFALIIVYAGAILITYLFVIMLATQAPSEDHLESLADYDTQARAPFVAAVTGFVLLAALTTMLFRGVGDLPIPAAPHPDALLAQMPNKASPDKVMLALKRRGELREGDQFAGLDPLAGDDTCQTLRRVPDSWPSRPKIKVGNVESIGFNLLSEHPGTIEIAGVILLMAMLGATVLSRKQVEFEEEAKLRQSQELASAGQVLSSDEGGGMSVLLTNATELIAGTTLAQTGFPDPMGSGILSHYLFVSAALFVDRPDRVPDPAEPDHHVPVHGADVPGRGDRAGGVRAVSPRFHGPDVRDLCADGGGGRGGDGARSGRTPLPSA